MKPRLLALVPLALAVSACAVGDPKPATYVTDISATLNGDAYSSIPGDLRYWFRYGETTAYGTETAVRTIDNEDTVAHPVSEPISGLSADTTYHWQMCVQDDEEDPPRDICSSDRTFTTGPAGGHSGIAYSHGGPFFGVVLMDGDGSDPVNLSALTPGARDVGAVFSPDGRELAFQSVPARDWQIFAMGVDGSDRRDLTDDDDTLGHMNPAWSPNGSKITFTVYRDGSNPEIEVIEADGSNRINLTNHAASDAFAAWSPDGSRIAFASDRDGNHEIYVMDADGSNPVRLTADPAVDLFPAWSPDGTKLAFTSYRDGDAEIYVMDADGGNPVPLTDNTASDIGSTWSPDGSQIAFSSGRRNIRGEIYVMDADGSDETNLTTNTGDDGDVGPAWSPRPEPVE